MSRRTDPARIHQARRAARVARLRDGGLSEEEAESLVAAWEAKADGEGRLRGTAAFWAGAEEELRRR